jgi:hypothetical protein
MFDIPFDRSIFQLSNGIRRVMPSTDTKPELTAKASMAQPVSQPAVCSSGLRLQTHTFGICNTYCPCTATVIA